MTTLQADVVVVGAGSAGCSVAGLLARGGFDVVLLEAKERDDAGAHWVNGVPEWVFEKTGLPQPEGKAVCQKNVSFLMCDKDGNPGSRVPPTPIWQVQMREWNRQLLHWAEKAGVRLFEQTRVLSLKEKDGRVVGLEAKLEDTTLHFEADLFVDASGNSAALRKQHSLLSQSCLPPATSDLCSASQQVYRIREGKEAEARLFAETYDLKPGLSLAMMGVESGFSTLTVQVHLENREVDILTGTAVQQGARSGTQLAQEFVEKHSWIGERIEGGSGWIPLRRPYDTLVAPGLALIGNAACQVFPGHGSGVGMGCLAASLLAKAVKGSKDLGSWQTLWQYQCLFQREYGAILGGFDVFRRATQAMSSEDIRKILHAGLMRPNNTWAAMAQQLPSPSMVEMFWMALAALKAPSQARRLMVAAIQMQRVARHYRRYPTFEERERLPAWASKAARMIGAEPDSVERLKGFED